MKYKKIIIILLCICISTTTAFITYYFRNEIKNCIIRLIARGLDRAREEDIGRYTVMEWGDGKFRINHDASGNRLYMHENNNTEVIVMENIIDYKEKNGKLYVVSAYGEVVVNNNNIAYVHIEDYNPEVDKDSKITRDGVDIIFSKHYDSDSIVYLNVYNDFAEEDKRVFGKLKD